MFGLNFFFLLFLFWILEKQAHKSPQKSTSTCVLSITLEENVATQKDEMSRPPFSKQSFQKWKNQAGRKQV